MVIRFPGVSPALAGAVGSGEIPRRAGQTRFAVKQDAVSGELPDGGAVDEETFADAAVESPGLGRRTGGMEHHQTGSARGQ